MWESSGRLLKMESFGVEVFLGDVISGVGLGLFG